VKRQSAPSSAAERLTPRERAIADALVSAIKKELIRNGVIPDPATVRIRWEDDEQVHVQPATKRRAS
jgi:hypothetical protein